MDYRLVLAVVELVLALAARPVVAEAGQRLAAPAAAVVVADSSQRLSQKVTFQHF